MEKKGTAAAILALMPSKKGESKEEPEADEADGNDEAKAAAGEELAAAIKSGDGAAIAAAFESLMDCCGY